LIQLLESLKHQSPATPEWLLESPRYLFVHRHQRNAKQDLIRNVTDLADAYNFSVHFMEGLHLDHNPLNLNANYAWYKMMRYLFGSNEMIVEDVTVRKKDDSSSSKGKGMQVARALQEEEALIFEEDIFLAHDALLMSAAMFQEKWRRPDVHNIVLGGWSGSNRINPDPATYLAVRSEYFQAMGYSMSRDLFEVLEKAKQDYLLYHKIRPREVIRFDWTEEITDHNYIPNPIQLTPSIGRMTHVGVYGMGRSGNGEKRAVMPEVPWKYWNQTIHNTTFTTDSYHLAHTAGSFLFSLLLVYLCLRLVGIAK
jgi:hypothetical protein